jgi:hypothetical protein
VHAAIRGACLLRFLAGDIKATTVEILTKEANGKEEKKPNPTLEDWEATDQ